MPQMPKIPKGWRVALMIAAAVVVVVALAGAFPRISSASRHHKRSIVRLMTASARAGTLSAQLASPILRVKHAAEARSFLTAARGLASDREIAGATAVAVADFDHWVGGLEKGAIDSAADVDASLRASGYLL